MATLSNWPLPSYQGRPPVISSGYGKRGSGAQRKMHSGADIDYRAVPSDPPYQGHYTADRSPNYYGPAGTPVIAATTGLVTKARMQTNARGVVEIQAMRGSSKLAPKIVTIYRHMSVLFVKKGDQVQSGQRLGVMGGSKAHPFRHVHFAVKMDGKFIDPAPLLRNKSVLVLTPAETISTGKPGLMLSKKGFPWLILLAILVVAKSKSR